MEIIFRVHNFLLIQNFVDVKIMRITILKKNEEKRSEKIRGIFKNL